MATTWRVGNGAATGQAKDGPSGRRRGLSDSSVGILLALPAAALFAAIAVYPLVSSVITSFYRESLVSLSRQPVGLANYGDVLPEFWSRLQTTLTFSVLATATSVGVGLGLGILLNARFRGRTVLRGALMTPWVLPGVVVSFLWAWIFNANYGVLNMVLARLHLTSGDTNWLGSPHGAMAAIVVAKTWQSFPWIMAVTLAALQAVPPEQLEAAAVDGANRFQRFRHVTLPRITPALALISMLEFIYNFGNFDTVYVMTGGGPGDSTMTLAVDVYQYAFSGFDLGHAAALGSLWLIVLAAVSGAYLLLSRRLEDR